MANHVHFSINLDLDDGQIALLEDTMKKVETENGEMNGSHGQQKNCLYTLNHMTRKIGMVGVVKVWEQSG